MADLTVVKIVSPSFSGTTWLNILLACHPDGLALGPLDELWRARNDLTRVCQVHGPRCPFWATVAARLDPRLNLFVQLAEITGKRLFVVNNPDASRAELEDSALTVKPIVVVRDGRAITSSFFRKYPTRFGDYPRVVRDWWRPVAEWLVAHARCAPGTPLVRYEDLIDDLDGQLATLADYLGVSYAENVARYWEFEHHIPAGNGGPIYILAKKQGQAHIGEDGDEVWYGYYREQVASLDKSGTLKDERWRHELSRRDRFAFDFFAGDLNAQLAYERDTFEPRETAELGDWLAGLTRPAKPRARGRAIRRHLRAMPRRARGWIETAIDRLASGPPTLRRHRPIPSDVATCSIRDDVRAAMSASRQAGALLPLSEYERLLELLTADPFRLVSLAELESTRDPDRILVGIRHDVDLDIWTCLAMSAIEREAGVHSSYFLLHSSPAYYGRYQPDGVFERYVCMLPAYRAIRDNEQEIGLHIDPLGVAALHRVDGIEAMLAELAFLRDEGLGVVEVAGHNSHSVYGADNKDVFSGQNLVAEPRVATVGGIATALGTLPPTAYGIRTIADLMITIDYRPAGRRVSSYGYVVETTPVYRFGYDLSLGLLAGGRWEINGNVPDGGPVTVANGELPDYLRRLPAGSKLLLLVHPGYYSA